MSMKKRCVAMLLAGGQGSRLAPLTTVIAKPAVPFAANYRIIDFSLSNCVNSEIDTVGVLTQYQPLELIDYLGTGAPWDLNLSYGGLHVLPPYEAKQGASWFKGTANAIYQNISFIKRYDPDYVLILSGDHIYKMNYEIMLQEHIRNNADCTISVIEVPMEEASRFGIMSTDREGRITEFAEKPAEPKSNLASMGVYIFNTSKLIKYLEDDEADPDSENDFGKNIIPDMLADGQRMFAYLYAGYWRDVGTRESFWAANMDALGEKPILRLNDPAWRIYYRHNYTQPQYVGPDAAITNSMTAVGCSINGRVENSVISSQVVVEKDAVVRDCVIMSNVKIRSGARVEYCIIDKDTEIGPDASVGAPKEGGSLTVSAAGLTISAGANVPAGTILTENI